MLNYHDLTISQKKWVHFVETLFPRIKDTLTYKDVQEIHEHLYNLRKDNPKYKCSKPLWLITNNAISRGVYKFPSSAEDRDEPPTEPDSELELRYRQELAKLNIVYKKTK